MGVLNRSNILLGISFCEYLRSIERSLLPIVLMCVLFVNSVPSAFADSIRIREEKIKVAVIYKLLKFVEWPEESIRDGDSFCMCIVGKNQFGNTLDNLNGQHIKGSVVDVAYPSSIEQLDYCHALFITGADDGELREFLRQDSSRPLLTIGESDGFIDRGGMIGLFTKNNRVRFEINVKSAKNNGLAMSYQLQRLARKIIQ